MNKRQEIIERLEGVSGITADWSSLTTEQLLQLLFMLLDDPKEVERCAKLWLPE